MARISAITLLAALISIPVLAQPSPGENTGGVKLDNAQVRVLEFTLAPHQPTPPHEHPLNRVIIFRDAGQMTVAAGSKSETTSFKAGEARWNPAGPAYVSENLTDHPIQIVEVEIKNGPMGSGAVLTDLDPPIADGEHYKVMFENEQVRVLHVLYNPHEKGGRHQHARDRLVVNLSPSLRAKYGDVRMIGPETHAEENLTDEPVERIAIEIK